MDSNNLHFNAGSQALPTRSRLGLTQDENPSGGQQRLLQSSRFQRTGPGLVPSNFGQGALTASHPWMQLGTGVYSQPVAGTHHGGIGQSSLHSGQSVIGGGPYDGEQASLPISARSRPLRPSTQDVPETTSRIPLHRPQPISPPRGAGPSVSTMRPVANRPPEDVHTALQMTLSLQHRYPQIYRKLEAMAALRSLEDVDVDTLAEDNKRCNICYENYGVADDSGITESPSRLLECKHIFGSRCLRTWIKTKGATCPYCRRPIKYQGEAGYAARMFLSAIRARNLFPRSSEPPRMVDVLRQVKLVPSSISYLEALSEIRRSIPYSVMARAIGDNLIPDPLQPLRGQFSTRLVSQRSIRTLGWVRDTPQDDTEIESESHTNELPILFAVGRLPNGNRSLGSSPSSRRRATRILAHLLQALPTTPRSQSRV